MPNYPVTTSARDGVTGTHPDTTATLLRAEENNSSGVHNLVFADIDTSAIGTDTITAATLYWYHDSYTKTKAATFSRNVLVGGVNIFNSSATPAAAGWHSEALTGGELVNINKTGDTAIEFSVDDPGSTYFRLWTIRAWDYDSGASACYLAITHAAAGGPTKMTIVRA